MRIRPLQFLLLLSCHSVVCGANHYVNLNNPNPVPPYTDWATAATNIQDAITAASAGEIIWVTNGVYQTGGKVAIGNNRVAVDQAVTVASVNGPEVTVILGENSRIQARCVYLTNGALLSGFTLTNGTVNEQLSGSGGGVYCASAAARVTNCVLAGNSAFSAGGAYQGTFDNCTFRSNSTTSLGGGAYGATLNNCMMTGNRASSGGGAASSTLNNCTVTGNSASSAGGGAYQGTLNNSIAYFNTAPSGANFSGSSLNYCCTTPLPGVGTGNIGSDPQLASASHLSAGSPCRGAGSAALAGGSDIDGEAWDNPPAVGCDEYFPGNLQGALSVSITASYTNVTTGYPITFAGTIVGKTLASSWDFDDGVVLSNQPYASHAWSIAGDYTVRFTAFNQDYPAGLSATSVVQVNAQSVFFVAQDSSNPIAPYTNWATAATDIQSALDLAVVPGQSVLVSNGLYKTGGKMAPSTSTSNRVTVTRAVRVSSVNGPEVTVIEGQRGAGGGIGAGAVRCVYLVSGAVLDGFSLASGATTSFDSAGGVYCVATAAVVTNCLFHANYGYLGGGVYSGTLNHCVLRFNSAYASGGGGYQTTFNNCTLSNNAANLEGGNTSYGTINNSIITEGYAVNYGGGTRYSIVNNCILRRNRADYGGGAYQSTLNNCTLVDNYGYVAAGAMYQSTLRNCIVYYNGSPSSPNGTGNLNYCCTTPNPGAGAGNITNAPLFLNQAAADMRLQATSPCINAGRNAYASGTDADGNPRIVGGTVDLGAYEFQSPASVLSYAWAQQYGLAADGSVDTADADGDGLNNWQEWMAGTEPTNAASALRVQTPIIAAGAVELTWSSVTSRAYAIECATDLGFPTFLVVSTNIAGKPGTTSFTNAGAFSSAARFYRVRVEQ